MAYDKLGVWHDPGNGQFAKPGFSSAKALALKTMREVIGAMTRDRVKDRHRDWVILRTDLLADYDLHAGDVVDARFVDDDWAQVTVSDPDTGFDRVVKVPWSSFDDGWESEWGPSPVRPDRDLTWKPSALADGKMSKATSSELVDGTTVRVHTAAGGVVDIVTRDEHQAEAVKGLLDNEMAGDDGLPVWEFNGIPQRSFRWTDNIASNLAILDHRGRVRVLDDNNGGRRVEIGSPPGQPPTVVTITPTSVTSSYGTGDGFSWLAPERNPAASVDDLADAAVAVAPIAPSLMSQGIPVAPTVTPDGMRFGDWLFSFKEVQDAAIGARNHPNPSSGIVSLLFPKADFDVGMGVRHEGPNPDDPVVHVGTFDVDRVEDVDGVWAVAFKGATGLVYTGMDADEIPEADALAAVKRVTDGLPTYNRLEATISSLPFDKLTDPDPDPDTVAWMRGALVSASTATLGTPPMAYDAGDGQVLSLGGKPWGGTTLWRDKATGDVFYRYAKHPDGTPGPVNGTVLATGTTEEQARSILYGWSNGLDPSIGAAIVEQGGSISRTGRIRTGDGRTLTPDSFLAELSAWAMAGEGREGVAKLAPTVADFSSPTAFAAFGERALRVGADTPDSKLGDIVINAPSGATWASDDVDLARQKAWLSHFPVLDTFKAAIRADLDTPDGLTEEERTQVVRDRVSRTLGMFNRQRNIQLDSALARWNMDLFTVVDNANQQAGAASDKGRAALESEVVADIGLPEGLTVDEKVDRLLDRLDTLTLNDGRPAVAGIIDGLLDTQNGSWADSSQSNQATALQFAALDLQGPDVTGGFNSWKKWSDKRAEDNDYNRGFTAGQMMMARLMVASTYTLTQSDLDKRGFGPDDVVITYRGSDEPQFQMASTAGSFGDRMWVQTNPLAATASTYASSFKNGGKVVVAQRVPRSKIFATAATGTGTYSEHEVVTMGAPDGYLSALADAYPTRPDIEDVLRHTDDLSDVVNVDAIHDLPSGEQTATLGAIQLVNGAMTGPELPDGLVDSLRAGDLSALNHNPAENGSFFQAGAPFSDAQAGGDMAAAVRRVAMAMRPEPDRVNFMADMFDAIDTYDFGGEWDGISVWDPTSEAYTKRPFTDNEKAVVRAAFKVGLARDMGIVGTTPAMESVPFQGHKLVYEGPSDIKVDLSNFGAEQRIPGRFRMVDADTPAADVFPDRTPRVAERDDVVDTGRVMKDVTDGDILVHDGRMVIVTSYDWPDGVGDDVTVWANDALTGDPLEWESTGGEVMPVVPGSPGLVDTTDVQPGMMIAHPETGERVLVSRLLPQSDWDENEIEVVTAPGQPPTTVRTTMDQLVVFGDDDAGWASVSASSVAPGDRVQTFYSGTTVVGTVTAATKNDEGGVDLDVAFDTPVYGDTGATIWFDDGDEVDKLTFAASGSAVYREVSTGDLRPGMTMFDWAKFGSDDDRFTITDAKQKSDGSWAVSGTWQDGDPDTVVLQDGATVKVLPTPPAPAAANTTVKAVASPSGSGWSTPKAIKAGTAFWSGGQWYGATRDADVGDDDWYEVEATPLFGGGATTTLKGAPSDSPSFLVDGKVRAMQADQLYPGMQVDLAGDGQMRTIGLVAHDGDTVKIKLGPSTSKDKIRDVTLDGSSVVATVLPTPITKAEVKVGDVIVSPKGPVVAITPGSESLQALGPDSEPFLVTRPDAGWTMLGNATARGDSLRRADELIPGDPVRIPSSDYDVDLTGIGIVESVAPGAGTNVDITFTNGQTISMFSARGVLLAGTPVLWPDVVPGTEVGGRDVANVEHLGGGVVRVDWADGDPQVFGPHDVARVTRSPNPATVAVPTAPIPVLDNERVTPGKFLYLDGNFGLVTKVATTEDNGLTVTLQTDEGLLDVPGIGPGGSTLALLGIGENDDTIPVGSVRVGDVVVDTDGLPHYVESAAPSGSATVKLTFADSATPVFVDSGEQVIRVDSGPDEDDIPNPQDIAVTPEKVGSANFRKLADDVTRDMLDNGDIRAWTPNVARRSLTPTEASIWTPDDWWGGYVLARKYNKYRGTFRGYVDEVMSRPDTPAPGHASVGIAKAAEEKAAEDSLPWSAGDIVTDEWGLTPDGGQVEVSQVNGWTVKFEDPDTGAYLGTKVITPPAVALAE